MRLVVLGEDLVAASFLEAAATAKDRIKEESKPVADDIADTQRQLFSQQWNERSGETLASTDAVEGEDDTLWEIGPETFWSRFLEDGTVKLGPRPWVGPSGDIHEADYYKVAEDVAADV